MFYEVRVLDAKGKVKKVISPKILSARYWERHFGDNPGPKGSTPMDFDFGSDIDSNGPLENSMAGDEPME
ncbi:MAG: hypothetical protein HY579_13740 [Nitrospinae bacterium]|nr:hypothetical protein [Nitrospinota bacterium]